MLAARIIKTIALARHRRRTLLDLTSMSDRQLDDLGLSHGDLRDTRRR